MHVTPMNVYLNVHHCFIILLLCVRFLLYEIPFLVPGSSFLFFFNLACISCMGQQLEEKQQCPTHIHRSIDRMDPRSMYGGNNACSDLNFSPVCFLPKSSQIKELYLKTSFLDRAFCFVVHTTSQMYTACALINLFVLFVHPC